MRENLDQSKVMQRTVPYVLSNKAMAEIILEILDKENEEWKKKKTNRSNSAELDGDPVGQWAVTMVIEVLGSDETE